jgi:hypothetical protein
VSSLIRRPPGWRPSSDGEPAPAGLPSLVLLAACRADPRWQDRAEAVQEALAWEPPTSAPQPLCEIPRHEAAAAIGAWGRHLVAERRAAKGAAGAEAGKLAEMPLPASAEAADARNALPPATDTRAESDLPFSQAKSMIVPERDGRAAWGRGRWGHKRRMTVPRKRQSRVAA